MEQPLKLGDGYMEVHCTLRFCAFKNVHNKTLKKVELKKCLAQTIMQSTYLVMIINDYVIGLCVHYIFKVILECTLSNYKKKFAVKQYA